MQKSQFTDAQIVAILQQAEKGEQTIADVCRQHNIAENTFYR
jgi:putative transposase